ncbi:MAG: sulfatase-like hydrolase/transferase [Akkermansiaceae bacterium]
MKKTNCFLFAFLMLGMGSIVLGAGGSLKRPNVIIIYTDDLGYGDLSCYGATAIQTPNIDRLASGGLRFTNGYAAASTCTPSRYSLLTGHLPFRQEGTGIARGDAKMLINPEHQTLPSMMKDAGYATACIGKWHLGLGDGKIDWNSLIKPGPNEIGFDYSFIIPATNDRTPCVYMENGRVYNLDPKAPLYVSYGNKVGTDPTAKEFPNRVKVKCKPGDHHNGTIHGGVGRIGTMSGGNAARWDDETMADDLAARAADFITKQKDQPFFLFFSTADIHAPRLFHPRFSGKSGLGPRGDMSLQLDDCVGQLMKTLDKHQLTEKTLIIFTSDNGPVLEDAYLDGSYAAAKKKNFDPAGPLRGTKYTAFEGGVRVPFIVTWAGNIQPGVSDAIIGQVDLLASLAKMAGQALREPKHTDSQNHFSALTGKNPIARNTIVCGNGIQTIRKGNWKLIPTKNPQLYNLKNDIAEKTNLASKYPEKVRALGAELIREVNRYHVNDINGKAGSLSLAGEWKFALDPNDYGISSGPKTWRFPNTIKLPGMLQAQGFGDAPSFKTKWTGETWRYPEMFVEWQKPGNFKFPFFLQPPRHYVGAAWYQREIVVPQNWKGHDIRVFLERPHWETTLWINGRKVGGMNSLGTPHRYDLGKIKPGKYKLTLRVDNRQDDVDVGGAAHSISDQTQGNWNGLVGKIELQALKPNRINRVDVYPSIDGNLKLIIDGQTTAEAGIKVSCNVTGEATAKPFFTAKIDKKGRFTKSVEGKVPFKPVPWSEFAPALYELTVYLGDNSEPFTTTFGFREMANKDGILTLNGKRIYLRGTLDCAIFPRLGHPPTEVEPWKRIIRVCQAHGLNHIRFHSWCPPKAAFIAADELGFYYQVEASAWASTVGDDGPFDAWLEVETELMRAEYGNHPSFILMAYGNEPHGKNHAKHLVGWVARQKKVDDRRLYTTGAGWPVHHKNDYQNPFQPRIQRWGEGLRSIINAKPPRTDFDWSQYVKNNPHAPIVSHEIGQWCAYPNYDEIEKYTGYFKARNFEIFKGIARRSGLLEQADDLLHASGRLQVLCYKHDIEAALRTPGFGGFQLLGLQDFTGQGTALVGVVDPFWDSKPYTSAEEFSQFCGPIVPLARFSKMIWGNDETLTAQLQLSHFGAEDLKQLDMQWKLVDTSGKVIASGQVSGKNVAARGLRDLGEISVPLNKVAKATQLKFTLSSAEHRLTNSWDLFVYPSKSSLLKQGDVVVTRDRDQALLALEKGQSVMLCPPASTITNDPRRPLQSGFSSIFWNTVYTKWQPPHTLGILTDPDHAALSHFPTDSHSNWQWWYLQKDAQPFILTAHQGMKPIVQVIDDWFTQRRLGLVFEANVGEGKLIACGMDLISNLEERPVARQLRNSLMAYMQGDEFSPSLSLPQNDLKALVEPLSMLQSLGVKAKASSEERKYEAVNAIDGKNDTLWHTEFSKRQPKPPHQLALTFSKPSAVKAVILTQRQDKNINGQVKEVVVLDGDGKTLAKSSVPLHAAEHKIILPHESKHNGVTIRVLTSHSGSFACLAEIKLK